MARISFIDRTIPNRAAGGSYVTDLKIVRTGGQDTLYATTWFDGALTVWGVDGGRPELRATFVFDGVRDLMAMSNRI